LLYGHINHAKVMCYANVYWAGSSYDTRPTSEYYVSIGTNLISCKSKKQSANAKYRVMASDTCELVGLK